MGTAGGAADADVERRPVEDQLAGPDADGKGAGLADEARHEGRRRLVVDLGRRADLLDLAVVEDGDAVGELDRLFLVVGDEDGGVAGAVVDLAQPAAQLPPDLGVEGAEGLVEEEHARLDGERAGERDALALAAGELRRVAVLEPAQLDEVEKLHDAPADLRLARTPPERAHGEAEGDVVEDLHAAEEGIALEDEADVALLHRQAQRVLAGEGDAAGIRRIEAGKDAEQRGLARARGAKEGDQLAGGDVDRDATQRRRGAELAHDPVDAHVDGLSPERGSAGTRKRGLVHPCLLPAEVVHIIVEKRVHGILSGQWRRCAASSPA